MVMPTASLFLIAAGCLGNAGRIGAIADQLSMVRETLWELDGRTKVLLFHELSTV